MAMTRSGIRVAIGALGGLASLLSGGESLGSADSTRLDLVKQRGELICGVSGKIPGMSFLRPDGGYEGFDVDICRAMADCQGQVGEVWLAVSFCRTHTIVVQ